MMLTAFLVWAIVYVSFPVVDLLGATPNSSFTDPRRRVVKLLIGILALVFLVVLLFGALGHPLLRTP